MSNVIDIQCGDSGDHLIDPPIVDFLFVDRERDTYVITFVPQDSVSRREKEVVEVPRGTSDGKRIGMRLEQIGNLVGGNVERLFHAGGGDFGFYEVSGELYQISKHSPSLTVTQALYAHLQDLSVVAEIVFCSAQTPATKTA